MSGVQGKHYDCGFRIMKASEQRHAQLISASSEISNRIRYLEQSGESKELEKLKAQWCRYDKELEAYTTKDVLLLVDVHVTLKEIRSWSTAKRRKIEQWAGAMYLRASDNIVKIPKCPRFRRIK